MATEKISFKKYPKLCQLEANEIAGKEFIHYVAKAKRCVVVESLDKVNFFSLMLDGSTDKGNCDNQLVLVVWCDVDGKDE